MRLRTRIIVSLIVGASLAGAGFLSVYVGGWGPCGPASGLSLAGGYLSIWHVGILEEIFPQFTSRVVSTGSQALWLALLFGTPITDLACLAFLILSVPNALRWMLKKTGRV
jgi:uncharacterized membrane protein YjjP (DUF1212 family)